MNHHRWYLSLGTALLIGLSSQFSSSCFADHLIGWQTFDNRTAGNNNSGIVDDTPDTNSTFDFTPVGSNLNGAYLSASIGDNASGSGWDGLGQATNNNFLNGNNFGSSKLITDYTLADGSPGTRIGPFGQTGTSSWKFSQANGANQLLGDFSVTNHSDYSFRLEFLHFDARGLANPATSPNNLDVLYLAGPGELINAATNTEVQDLRNFYSNTWTSTGVENVSQSVANVIGSAARIAPGKSASFRFRWAAPAGDNGQAQLDNIAFSGTFLDQNNGFVEIDPLTVTAVPEPGTASILLIGMALVALRRKRD